MPTIGLSFIFKNDESTIGAMLDSFLPYVDEVIATDTGCTDSTRRIVVSKLKKFKGRFEIRDYEWTEDFAAARQPGWDSITSDWGLWADADDTLEGGPALARLVERAEQQHSNPPIGGFIFNYDYAHTPEGVCVCVLPRERLVRMSVGWRWASPVHEVLIAQTPCQFVSTDAATWIHHKVAKPEEGTRNRLIIERHIAQAEAEGVDPDPRLLNYMGVEHAARGEHAEAIECYLRYMQVSGWGEEKHQAYHRMADSYRALGEFDKAIEAETYALTHTAEHGVPEWPDHLAGIAEAMMGKGEWSQAAAWFERALLLPMPVSSMILNPRDYDYGPHLGLSLCYFELREFDKAALHVNECLKIMPSEVKGQMHAHRVAVKQKEARVIAATVDMLEALVAYDENLKAREVIRHIPYVARGDERVFHLTNHIRRSTYQVGSHTGYAHMYETNREVRNPDDFVENASDMFVRAAFLKAGLEHQRETLSRKPLYLDAGCNDGWMGAHMEHVLGLVERADGIDLNPEGVRAAIDRAERYSLKGEFKAGFVEEAASLFEDRYDAISMFEVFEHLEDPHSSVAALEQALAPGGVMYISTPAGAFEKGLITNWGDNENKQHLRAVTNAEFARFALQRGSLLAMETGESDGVQVISYEPVRRKGRVVLWLGPAWERWSPLDIETRGLGGSETAAVKLAKGLAEAGWFVDVYGGLLTEGPYEDVMYQNYTMYDPDEPCDVFISSRDATAVSQLVPNTKVSYLWCHDAHVGGNLAMYANDYAGILCLTDSHERLLREAENLQDDSYDELFMRTRNGLDLSRWESSADLAQHDRQKIVLYTSSPDRGLDQLVGMWPSIRFRVPDAELHVYYGFDVFDQMHSKNPAMMAWKSDLMKKIAATSGVFLKGRVGQQELAVAQSQARVWAYPYALDNPTETSCITAMESMAAGLVCVTTDTAALPETLGDAGVLIRGAVDSDDYRQNFIDAVCKGLTDPEFFERFSTLSKLRSTQFSWDDVAQQWDSFLTEALHEPALALLGAGDDSDRGAIAGGS